MYGLATVSRIDKMIGLFCRILSVLQGSFAKETYNLIDATNQSQPICTSTTAILHSNKSHISLKKRVPDTLKRAFQTRNNTTLHVLQKTSFMHLSLSRTFHASFMHLSLSRTLTAALFHWKNSFVYLRKSFKRTRAKLHSKKSLKYSEKSLKYSEKSLKCTPTRPLDVLYCTQEIRPLHLKRA